MNHNEEKNFKEYIKDTTPDLWAKIDSKLPSGMYTKDSSDADKSDSANDKEQDEPSSNKVVKFKPRKIYKISAILAASLVLVSLAVYNIDYNNGSYKSKNTADFAVSNDNKDDNSSVNKLYEDNSSDENFTFDKNIGSNDDPNSITDNTNIHSNTEQESTDTKNPADSNVIPNSTIPPIESDNIDSTIKVMVSKQHTTDIGLVYEGIVIDSNSKTITKKQTVYISLRNLSRHDLLHTYTTNEQFVITIADDSYTSTVDKPFYASKMIEGIN